MDIRELQQRLIKHSKQFGPLLFAAVILGGIGVLATSSLRAETLVVATEAENGIIAGNATTDTASAAIGASGIAAVRFGGGNTTPHAGQKVFVIGDSLTAQYLDNVETGSTYVPQAMHAVGWPTAGIQVYSWPGKPILDTDPGGHTTIWNIQQLRAAYGEPDLWIFALVTNDNVDSSAKVTTDMQTVFSELGPSARVMWVNEGVHNLQYSEELRVNAVVAQQVAARPHSYLADWHDFLSNPSLDQTNFWTDGTHMTRAGYDVRNAFVADQSLQAMIAP
jgi:lysophospholipase L1-like esterase